MKYLLDMSIKTDDQLKQTDDRENNWRKQPEIMAITDILSI